MMKLDYGCGSGGFQEISADRLRTGSWLMENGGPDTWAIDVNPDNIKKARLRINNGTKFMVADGKKLPFQENSFDILHEHGVLHHIQGYQDAIKEIARVMKPNGILLMKESVDNDPVFRLFRRILGKWQGDDISSMFTSDELDQALEPYFNILYCCYYWRFTISDCLRMYHIEPSFSLRFNHWISRMFFKLGIDSQMCSHYVLVAVRK